MSWLPRKSRAARPPQTFIPEPIDFIGEQVGPAEESLKASFREVFSTTPTVQSAYLARVYWGSATTESVTLCIRSSIGADAKLEERITEIFRSRFRPDQRLDLLFVLEDDEAQLRKICPAFYERRL